MQNQDNDPLSGMTVERLRHLAMDNTTDILDGATVVQLRNMRDHLNHAIDALVEVGNYLYHINCCKPLERAPVHQAIDSMTQLADRVDRQLRRREEVPE
jgi:hypothetical protein